jgi:hypothetical protein
VRGVELMKKSWILGLIAPIGSVCLSTVIYQPEAQALDFDGHAHGIYAPGTPPDQIGFEASDFVLGPTTPGNWGPAGTTVTYSFMSTGVSCAAEFAGCTITSIADLAIANGLTFAQFRSEIVRAFNAWTAVTNINFAQVADDGAAFNAATTSGDIRIGSHTFDGPNGTLAHAFFPPNNGFTAAGDLHFDIAETWKIGFGGAGFDIFQVAAHEIGHAIGLDHTGVPNSLMNPFYTEAFSGPQADDIAGAQSLYGAPVPFEFSAVHGIAALAGLYGFDQLRRKRKLKNSVAIK